MGTYGTGVSITQGPAFAPRLIPSGFVGFRRCRYRRLEGIQLVQNGHWREVDYERRYEPDYRCETSDDEMRKMR
jgi:hypothetical protein